MSFDFHFVLSRPVSQHRAARVDGCVIRIRVRFTRCDGAFGEVRRRGIILMKTNGWLLIRASKYSTEFRACVCVRVYNVYMCGAYVDGFVWFYY